MKPRFVATAALLLAFSPLAVRAQAPATATATNPATNPAPLKLIATTPLPDVTGGDFDHFAVDLRGNRLYVVAEDYASIEVFDLHSGKHLRSVRGVVKSPRKIAFLPDKNQLLVADAGDASLEFLDAKDLHQVASVPLEAGPDAGVYDPKTRIFYVGNGGHAAQQAFAYISKVSVDSHQVIGRIRVEATTLKTVLLDPDTQTLYVTLRDKNEVAAIDLKQNAVAAVWSNPEFHVDSAMAYDPSHHRLFVGDRKPGRLIVLDTSNDAVVATLPIGDTSDDMTYDAAHHRVYISTADGLDVVSQDSPDHYHLLQHIDTLGGKTSVYVPSLHRFFVVHTRGEQASQAGLQIFAVR